MSNTWKIDITSQVKGHVENGEVILTFNGKPISRFLLDGSSESEGFVIEQGKVFKETRFQELNVQEEYARDCDMGWC